MGITSEPARGPQGVLRALGGGRPFLCAPRRALWRGAAPVPALSPRHIRDIGQVGSSLLTVLIQRRSPILGRVEQPPRPPRALRTRRSTACVSAPLTDRF